MAYEKHDNDVRTLRRKCGETFTVPKLSHYTVWIRCRRRRRAHQVRQFLHLPLCDAGGYNATRGLTDEWAEGRDWLKVKVPIASGKLYRLLKTVDRECEAGLIEVRVCENVFGRQSQP